MEIKNAGNEADAATRFLAQKERVINMYLVPGGNPLEELKKLDSMFVEAGGAVAPQIDATARELLENQSAFDNLNFQSSILTDGSAFFGKVIRRMGELVDSDPRYKTIECLKLPVLIRLVEHYRRKQTGKSGDAQADDLARNKMDEYSARVEEELRSRVEANDPLALGQLAKVRYEQSMGAFGRKDYVGSIGIGEESIALCERAGDMYGVLAARGNTAGLSRYTLAKTLDPDHPRFRQLLEEGRPVLEADLKTAQDHILSAQQGSPEKQKFVRVEFNNAAHLMEIAALQGDLALARAIMQVLEKNPIYANGAALGQFKRYSDIVAELGQPQPGPDAEEVA